MTGAVVAALALSAATLIPASPRRRLGPAASPLPAARDRRRWPVAGCVAGCAAATAGATLPVTTSLAAAALAATIGLRLRRRIRRRHGIREARALEAALDVLIGDLRVGVHPVRAFGVAAAETDHPFVAAGLRAVAARARLGADVPAGLRGVAKVASLPDQWERLAVYWQLGCEHGLAISTLMHAAQRDIAERQRFAMRVNSGMAGARSSAAILAALPVLGVLLGQLIGAQPVSFLLSSAGGGLLVAGAALACVGMLWSDRITERLT